MSNAGEIVSEFERLANGLALRWDGTKAVSELKEADFNWRQMEWFGFYFEHLVRQDPVLSDAFGERAEIIENTAFDGFASVPWDLKTHVTRDRSGNTQPRVILNDEDAIDEAVQRYGSVCVAILIGAAEFDEDGSFYAWHQALKGGQSVYQLSDPSRRRRVRKSAFLPQKLAIFELGQDDLALMGRMNQGRNSNGEPRPPKYMLDLAVIQPSAEFPIGVGSSPV